jgi:hypothetical protein
MGLVISKGLTLRKDYRSAFADPDVQAYLSAVEQADGQALEYPVAYAVDEFVRGCKADGIWDAIKASCILAGARTRLGALTPLVGTAPTSFNFVDDDYNRKTGLVGDGSTKYLDSNRNNNADPINSVHQAVFMSQPDSGGAAVRGIIGAQIGIDAGPVSMFIQSAIGVTYRNRSNTAQGFQSANPVGLAGHSRSESTSYIARLAGSNTTFTVASDLTAQGTSIFVFTRNGVNNFTNARLAFYSIGESLDLALLDARVTDLINAFGAAIP